MLPLHEGFLSPTKCAFYSIRSPRDGRHRPTNWAWVSHCPQWIRMTGLFGVLQNSGKLRHLQACSGSLGPSRPPRARDWEGSVRSPELRRTVQWNIWWWISLSLCWWERQVKSHVIHPLTRRIRRIIPHLCCWGGVQQKELPVQEFSRPSTSLQRADFIVEQKIKAAGRRNLRLQH